VWSPEGEKRAGSIPGSILGKLPTCENNGSDGLLPRQPGGRNGWGAMPSSGLLTAIHSVAVRLHVAHVGAGEVKSGWAEPGEGRGLGWRMLGEEEGLPLPSSLPSLQLGGPGCVELRRAEPTAGTSAVPQACAPCAARERARRASAEGSGNCGGKKVGKGKTNAACAAWAWENGGTLLVRRR